MNYHFKMCILFECWF